MVRTFISILVLVTIGDSEAKFDPSERAVPDPIFERRLTETKVYRAKKGDTLVKLAYVLYGHRTWWKKLRKANGLKSYSPYTPLLEGSEIKYRAPKVGETYVVQKNDWLIRIATWKFGDTDFWRELYENNKEQISKPDLIHPGDTLIFEEGGTIRILGQDSALVKGVEKGSRTLAFIAKRTGIMEKNGYQYFVIGFLVGLMYFLLLPGSWLRARLRQKSSFYGVENEVVAPSLHRAPSPPRTQEPMVDSKFTFKNGPSQHRYELDRSLFRKEDGEVDLRPGYHTLTADLIAKFLRSLRKK